MTLAWPSRMMNDLAPDLALAAQHVAGREVDGGPAAHERSRVDAGHVVVMGDGPPFESHASMRDSSPRKMH